MATAPTHPLHNVSEHWVWDYRVRKTDIAIGVAGAVAASRIVIAGGDVHVLVGYAITETTGINPASFRLHDGNSNQAEQFCRVNLAANESRYDTIGHHGAICSTGRIFIDILQGSVEGVVFWLPAR